jgi:uncharacterized protein YoaH (UPF0181 family)
MSNPYEQDALEFVGPKGWSHGWIRGAVGAAARGALSAGIKSDPKANAGAARDISSLMGGIQSAEHQQILNTVTPANAVDSVRQLMSRGMSAQDAAKAVTAKLKGQGKVNQSLALLKSQGNAIQAANSYPRGRVIGLARRLPVRQDTDIMVSRAADGTAVVRHRRGGNEVGHMKRTDDGWTPVVNGKALTPHRHQRAALIEMFGTYNREAAAEPFTQPPVQTPLMQQYGIPAVRLANDDGDNDDAASSDTSSDSNGLSPRGQGIYKKLIAKGVKPPVAMAMAKRAQTKTAGSFGGK